MITGDMDDERIKIRLNDEQWAILYAAATDPLGLHTKIQMNFETGITIYETPTRAMLVNAAWERIAPDFGVDHKSPKLDPENGERAFTAIPLQTPKN